MPKEKRKERKHVWLTRLSAPRKLLSLSRNQTLVSVSLGNIAAPSLIPEPELNQRRLVGVWQDTVLEPSPWPFRTSELWDLGDPQPGAVHSFSESAVGGGGALGSQRLCFHSLHPLGGGVSLGHVENRGWKGLAAATERGVPVP